MLTFIAILASVVQLLVSLFVLLQGRRNLSYVLFFLIGVASMSWAFVNFYTTLILDSENLLYFVRFILTLVVIQNTFFYLFARIYPETIWPHSRKWLMAYLLFSVVAVVVTLTPYLFTSVEVVEGIAVTKAGPAILIFITHALLSITLALRSLFKKYHRSQGLVKTQFKILILASVLNWVAVPITNFAGTTLLNTTIFLVASPIYTLLFASIIAYAMIARHLFDIRAVVTRFVTYLLTIGTLVSIFVLGGLYISNQFLELPTSVTQQLYLAVLAVSFALIFQPIKRFYDKVTNKIFYRDDYDSGEILDEFGDFLVAEIEDTNILKHTAEALDKSIKPTKAFAFLYSRSESQVKDIIGKYDVEDSKLNKTLEYQQSTVVVVEDASYTHKEAFARNVLKVLRERRVAVSIRLFVKDELVGFLLLGDKKDGSLYKNKDITFLNIMANSLSVALQNAQRFEEIQQFNATLQGKIERATKELTETNEKLKELDTAKDEFISMASHQLRTPLTAIKGYVSMLMEGDMGDVTPAQKEMLNSAFTSSQRMVYLIADFLNVSRLKTGKFIIDPKEVYMPDLVENEISQLYETAASRKITIKYDKPKVFPRVMLDENKIQQVIMNFTDNAIYYGKTGGTIRVHLTFNEKIMEFTVTDDGIGVPKENQKNLFTKFYRGDNARKARPDGTGLGLFMAKKVVVAQGGAIIFKSKEGQGSTFGFTFPLDKIRSTN